jgi:hypothetical protein
MIVKILPSEIVRLYRVWTSMLYSAGNPSNKQYKNYGGRGITICDRWLDFNNFCEDVQEGTKIGLHLDRIDNEKGYFKENCRWTTPKTNHRNKRNNRYYETHLGKVCQSELIEEMKFTRKQFQRAVEKYGINKLLDLFENDKLPKKKSIVDLSDIIGLKFNKFTVGRLDSDKSTGSRYFCTCDCGRESRFLGTNL